MSMPKCKKSSFNSFSHNKKKRKSICNQNSFTGSASGLLCTKVCLQNHWPLVPAPHGDAICGIFTFGKHWLQGKLYWYLKSLTSQEFLHSRRSGGFNRTTSALCQVMINIAFHTMLATHKIYEILGFFPSFNSVIK